MVITVQDVGRTVQLKLSHYIFIIRLEYMYVIKIYYSLSSTPHVTVYQYFMNGWCHTPTVQFSCSKRGQMLGTGMCHFKLFFGWMDGWMMKHLLLIIIQVVTLTTAWLAGYKKWSNVRATKKKNTFKKIINILSRCIWVQKQLIMTGTREPAAVTWHDESALEGWASDAGRKSITH